MQNVAQKIRDTLYAREHKHYNFMTSKQSEKGGWFLRYNLFGIIRDSPRVLNTLFNSYKPFRDVDKRVIFEFF